MGKHDFGSKGLGDLAKTQAIPDHRKKQLLVLIKHVLSNAVGQQEVIKGNKSFAMFITNKIAEVCKTVDEFKWSIDVITVAILQTKGKDTVIMYKGQALNREQLAKDHGIFLTPSNQMTKGQDQFKS